MVVNEQGEQKEVFLGFVAGVGNKVEGWARKEERKVSKRAMPSEALDLYV
jgi:hypothetical protein